MYRVQDDLEKAASFFNEALTVGRLTGQDLVVAVASLGLGQVHAPRLENNKAIEFYFEAMDIFTRNDIEQVRICESDIFFSRSFGYLYSVTYEVGRANALLDLGHTSNAQSKLDEALDLSTQARNIYIQIGHQLGRANASIELRNVFRAMSERSEAQTYYEDAHDYYGRVGNELGVGKTLHGLGDVYDATAEYGKASAAYDKAQQIFARIDRPLGRANALTALMPLRIREGRFQEAISSMEEAASIYESIGRTAAAAKAREVLSTIRQLLSEVEGGHQQ
ncbi:hypothetical protein FS837_004788 [Tulasnella sp. UAMH 9824]|nr:hypothetical protein FS837_004788 [Tulasnella sp. UAMH 9824]